MTNCFNSVKGESNVTIHLMRIQLNYDISCRTTFFGHYLTLLYSSCIYFVYLFSSGKVLENKITIQAKL